MTMTTTEVATYLQQDGRPYLGADLLGDQCDGWAYVLESALVHAHYSPEVTGGAVDGVFDAATQEALKSFQQSAGLEATGEVDDATWDALYGAVEQQAAAENEIPSAADFVDLLLDQVGDRYVFGHEVDLDDPDPDTFDCSELIQWGTAQMGVTFRDGSWNQIADVEEISVDEARNLRGALLWRRGHVAISLGTGNETVEARGSAYGVVEYQIEDRFERAGRIPGLRYD